MFISELPRSQHRSVSPTLLDYSLQMYRQTGSMMASKCVSKLARSQLPSVCPNSVDYGLQVSLQTCSNTAFEFARSSASSPSPNSLDRASKFAQLWPPSAYLQTCSIMASKVYLQIPSITACKSAEPWPSSASPNSLDHSLGVYLGVTSIDIFRSTSNCCQAPHPASPDILCVDG